MYCQRESVWTYKEVRRAGGVLCLLPLLLLLLIVSACGGASQSNQSHSSTASPDTQVTVSKYGIDPCMLVTKEKAGQALGGDVEIQSTNLLPDCIYRVGTHQMLTTAGISEKAKEYYTLSKSQVMEPKEVKGVGDAAFSLVRAISGTITVVSGKALYSISLTNADMKAGQIESTLSQLAKDALGTITPQLAKISTPEPDPCTLLTTGEASSALGEKEIYALNGINTKGVLSCTMLAAQDRTIFVNVNPQGNAQQARDTYEKMKAPNSKVIKGLGDEAFSNGPGKIDILQGDTIFGIAVSKKTALDDKKLQELANVALKRL